MIPDAHQSRIQHFFARVGKAYPGGRVNQLLPASEVARSAAEQATAGVWGRSPQWGQGRSPGGG